MSKFTVGKTPIKREAGWEHGRHECWACGAYISEKSHRGAGKDRVRSTFYHYPEFAFESEAFELYPCCGRIKCKAKIEAEINEKKRLEVLWKEGAAVLFH